MNKQNLVLEALKVNALTKNELITITEIESKEVTKELQRLIHKNKVCIEGNKYVYTKPIKQPTKVINQGFDMPNILSNSAGNEITFKVSQADTFGNENTFTQKFTLEVDNFNLILGTCMNRLFEYQSALQECNDRGAYKSTLPLVIDIEYNNQYLTTSMLPNSTQQNLKIGNTAKRKRMLCKKVYILTQFIVSEPTQILYTELDAELQKVEAFESEANKSKNK